MSSKFTEKQISSITNVARNQINNSKLPQEFVSTYDKTRNIKWYNLNSPVNLENKTWFDGDENQLEYFYKEYFKNFLFVFSGSNNGRGNNFYGSKTRKERVMHSGVPAAITNAKVNLIFDSKWNLANDELEQETLFDSFKDEWEEIKEKINPNKMLRKMAQNASIWKYGVALPILNTESNKIVDWFVPDSNDLIIVKQYNEVIEIRHVEKVYGKNNKVFYLHVVFAKGKIYHEVYRDEEFKVEASLSEISGTMANRFDITLNGFEDKLLAIYVEYEKDDYSGNVGFYDSLDETLSTRIDEARRGKLIRFIPKRLLEIDPDTGKVKKFKDFGLDFTVIDGKQEDIVISHVDIDQEKYNKSLQADISQILPNVGLSAVTFGKFMGGTEGKDLNSDREKLSIKTRKDLINNHWKHAIHNFVENTVLLTRYLEAYNGKGDIVDVENEDGTTTPMIRADLELPSFSIEFENYVKPSDEEKQKSNVLLLTSGAQSLFRTIKNLNPDFTDDEIEEEIEKIKEDKGLAPIDGDGNPQQNEQVE